jgi:hypothetical protein
MNPHPIQCRCGSLKGEVSHIEAGIRAVCYCRDCQAYAHVLGEATSVLDAVGGTDVVATQGRYLRFTSDTRTLACLSLSPRGLLRWFAACCSTPIANTPRNWGLPYAGLVHTCLGTVQPIERSWPKVQMRVNTHGASGAVPRMGWSQYLPMATFVPRMLGAGLSGAYRRTPFFDEHGVPRVEVRLAPRR